MLPLSTELQLLSPSSLAPQYAQVEEKKKGGGQKRRAGGGNTLQNNAGNPQRTMAQVFVKKKKREVHNEVYAAQQLTAHRNKQNTR